MLDHGERIVRRAAGVGHQFRAVDERRRHHADRRHPLALERDGVVQTARRATPSVADAGNDQSPPGQTADQIRFRRSTVVPLRRPLDRGHIPAFAQQRLQVVEQWSHTGFSVREQGNIDASQPSQPRRRRERRRRALPGGVEDLHGSESSRGRRRTRLCGVLHAALLTRRHSAETDSNETSSLLRRHEPGRLHRRAQRRSGLDRHRSGLRLRRAVRRVRHLPGRPEDLREHRRPGPGFDARGADLRVLAHAPAGRLQEPHDRRR